MPLFFNDSVTSAFRGRGFLSFSSSSLQCFFSQVLLSLSLFTGFLFPLHCVCGVHHAALLHAGRHRCQRPDLRLSHPRVERLALPDSRSDGTSGVAGKTLTKRTLITRLSHSVGERNVAAHCRDFNSFHSILQLSIQSNVFFFFQFAFKRDNSDYSAFHILHRSTSDL